MPQAENMRAIFLEPLESERGWPVLIQDMDEALYRGANTGAVDYFCGVCRTSCLAENVVEGEILEIAFRCHQCGGLSATPRLKPGDPITQPFVAFELGRYRITSQVQGRPRVPLVGMHAARRRSAETGIDSGVTRREGLLNIASSDDLRGMVIRARRVLGPLIDALRERDRRGISTPRTPPKLRHRIMEMVESIESAANSVALGHPSVDVVALIELNMLLDLFERWRRDPGIERILKEIENPASYSHAVICLAAASHLTDAGNGVAFATPGLPNERTPDLWVATGPNERIGVEVKAPLALQKRKTRLTARQARETVAGCLKRAGTGPRGQLKAERSGVLLIGGFHLSRKDIGLLEKAAEFEVRRRTTQRKHIMAIAIGSAGVLLENVRVSEGRVVHTESSRAHATITFRLAVNANYAGTLRISDRILPRLRPIDEAR